MAIVKSVSSKKISAAPEKVAQILTDYTDARLHILPGNFSDYKAESSDDGKPQSASWKLQATKKRVRSVDADIKITNNSITETDRNSSLVTQYVIAPDGVGSDVTVTTTWTGAGGIGGFFEKTFAPLGLKRIYDELLENLATEVNRSAAAGQ